MAAKIPSYLLSILLLTAGGCATLPPPSPAPTPSPTTTPAVTVEPEVPASPQAARPVEHHHLSALLALATGLQGIRYRYGGNSPKTGFDCSGFVQYVYRQEGIELPHSSRDMARYLPRVKPANRRPGDLVFFRIRGHHHAHVGIYLGNNRFVHAAGHRSKGVMISRLDTAYWHRRLDGVRRPPTAFGLR